MKTNAVGGDSRIGPWTRLLGMACVAILADFATTEVHEAFHFLAGRLVGLPAHFFNLTSVGVDAPVVERAPQYALALMNGVAPVMTVLLGVLALRAVPHAREKAPAAITAFLAWWAIAGIPYLGFQLMTAALPIRLGGDGSDSAAVIGGFLGVGIVVRTAISLVGLLLYFASGFWLGAALLESNSGAATLTLRQRLRELSAWRLVAASILGLLLIGMTVRSAMLLVMGNGYGFYWLLAETLVWAVMMALLVRWRAPGAREVRDHWIFPGLVASLGLIAIGTLPQLDDFLLLGVILTAPLPATAWTLMRESSPLGASPLTPS
jgi:hypothetical protein